MTPTLTEQDETGRHTCYLAARVIQLITPGMPQIYYVGALVWANDMDRLCGTGTGRDINRHVYDRSQTTDQVQRPVVRSLLVSRRGAQPVSTASGTPRAQEIAAEGS